MQYRAVLAALSATTLALTGLATTHAQAAPAKPVTTAVAPDGTVGTVSKLPGNAGIRSLKGNPTLRKGAPGGVSARLGVPQYWYSGGRAAPAGMYAAGGQSNISVAQPFLATGDHHTLIETSAEKVVGGIRQVVEIGWTVDRVVNAGSSAPHLFAGRWIGNQFQGYNGADPGFTAFCANGTSPCTLPQIGQSIAGAVGTQKKFGIQYFSGAWWINYDNQWVGYYNLTAPGPASLGSVTWPATFTDATMIQWFGEVVMDSTGSKCSDMGNGRKGSTATNPLDATDPTWVSSASLLAPTNQASTVLTGIADTNSAWYDRLFISPSVRTFGVGGPGNGGNIGSC